MIRQAATRVTMNSLRASLFFSYLELNMSDVPPCPESLLRKLSTPARFDETIDRPVDPGTVWEALAPDRETLLFVVTERISAIDGLFLFVRAVPLGYHLSLIGPEDVAVSYGKNGEILVAHCWNEMPVLASRLVRCIGELTPGELHGVLQARSTSRGGVPSENVRLYRESIVEQTRPVGDEVWALLYESLEGA